MNVNRIINECDAEHNDIDKRILYELTGIKLDQDFFADDSSFEADMSRMVDNLIGYRDRLTSIENVQPIQPKFVGHKEGDDDADRLAAPLLLTSHYSVNPSSSVEMLEDDGDMQRVSGRGSSEDDSSDDADVEASRISNIN